MLFQHVGRQLHHKNRAHVPEQRGCTAKNVAFESVDIELDELHLAIGKFGQHAVKTSGPCCFGSHFTAEMLGVQAGLPSKRPTRIDRRRDLVFVMFGQETMAGGHPGLELGVELEVAAKLAKSKIIRLEFYDPPFATSQLPKMHGTGADT